MTADRVRLPRRLLWASCALVLGAAMLLAGCNANTNVVYGTAVVTLTDTPGDFTSYIVAIDSITLTRNDGLIIEPLSTPETVDLTKVHDLSELVEAPAFPIGTYTSLTLLLDYTAPQITVEVNGQAVAFSPVDSTGAVMTAVTLTVNFDPANPLVINSQECTRLALDFNLPAFNTINLSASQVMVVPFMTATPAPADATLIRARGLLVVVQPDDRDYIVNIRPFADIFSALGALTVNTTATTYFNVNGTVYTGAAGLAAMQRLQVSTPVAAYGTLGSFATITPTFNATEVYAGGSLESPLADYVTGVVAIRSGDTLTMRGAGYISRLGAVYYLNDLPVTLSSATIVSEDGVVASGLTTQSISVGQVINVSGQATLNATTGVPTALDATGDLAGYPPGEVRLQPTELWGSFISATPGRMSLSLLTLGGFGSAAFNFTGTGTDSANDALFSAYVVDTGAVNESGAAADTLFEAQGIVTPFGSAPPNLTATAVTAPAPQELVVQWGSGATGGATAPFSSASSSGLVVNLANTQIDPAVRYLATGPQKTDLTSLAKSPPIVFATGTTLTLAIDNNATISIYNSASAFATELASTLNGTNAVYRLVAVGQYDGATNTFTATQVAVNLQIPATT
jgi:hypothetical protein